MSIRLEQITKRYQGVPVVNGVTLEVANGEFFVLLGPSGSGKSTLLRALAGLTPIDHGRISLHGRDVTFVPARHRGVGFVFQHYALFRHMSVADNIEFALRVRRVRAAERRRRRQELLKLVALEGLDERLPSQLSGGQQQRVAVARALAHEPAVLLLDEPFGALDARIRLELRETVRQVQRRLGTTTILVTHDQEEAFALADRIGIMHRGRLLETGSPEKLYRQPATRFAATFLGAANLFLAQRGPQGLRLGGTHFGARDSFLDQGDAPGEVIFVVRPEDIEVAENAEALASRSFAAGHIRSAGFAGGFERLAVEISPASEVRSAVGDGQDDARPTVAEVTRTAAERASLPLAVGRRVALGLRRLHALPTPISSILVASADAAARQELRSTPLVTQLVQSMQARVLESDDAAQRAGLVVLESGPQTLGTITRLVSEGCSRILCLSPRAPLPTRVLVSCTSDDARATTLALVSSVMRHLKAETTFVSIQTPAAPRAEVTASFRQLLDARAELQSAHGLDLRTEVHIGDAEGWLLELRASDEPTLLVLGVASARSDFEATVTRALRSLLTTESLHAVLFAHAARPTGTAAQAPRNAAHGIPFQATNES